ncbi:hypothetical protein ACR777_05035 [Sphingobacterium spiritivorum]|uniref:hypothetical protein n=1 Tax=Sphingobacterium spiritivorum TaxID=258 RepID=UPI003DA5A394
MKTTVLLLALLITNSMFAQSAYEKGMANGMQLWQSGKNTEAAAQFERIAQVEKDNWIPAYYQSFITILSAFNAKDADSKMSLIKTAKTILDAYPAQNNNPEWLVLKAMNYTAELTTDPMTKAQELSPLIIATYEKAKAIAPENPRVILNLAQFQMQSKKYFHQDTSAECESIKKALHLFDTQKSETAFAPSWGKEQAEQIVSSCTSK